MTLPSSIAMRSSRRNARTLAVFASIAMAVLVSACSSEPAARLVVRDERNALDVSRLEKAAAPLLARGADVALFVAAKGDDTGRDLTYRLNAEALGHDGNAGIAPSAIAIYVSYAPRYSELRAGSRWSEFLPSVTLRAIRDRTLNAALRRTDGDTADGIVATLDALDAAIASGQDANRMVGRLAMIGVGALVGGLLLAALLTGRFADMWAATPIGRWQQRRATRQRYRQEVEVARSTLTLSQQSARQRSEQSGIADTRLDAELAAIETTRADLFARPLDDPAVLADLRTLAERYRLLGESIDQAIRDVQRARIRVEAMAQRVTEAIATIKRSLGADRLAGAEASAVGDLALLVADFDACELVRAQLTDPARPVALTDLTILEARYGAVETGVDRLWQQAAPEAHADFMSAKAALSAKRQHGRAGTTPGENGATAQRESSPTLVDINDTGGGPSSDGGPW